MKVGIKKTIYNYDLRNLRHTTGFSQKEFSERVNVDLQRYNKIESLKSYPYEDEAFAIADYFNIKPDKLFPKWAISLYKGTRKECVEVIDIQRKALSSPEILAIEDRSYTEEIDDDFLKSDISKALETLKENEARVLDARFGLSGPAKTLEEVGSMFNVSRERVRQIEQKALRKLRHSVKFGCLQGYIKL